MSDTVIKVENLGKKYILGRQQQERYTALRDVLANGAKGLARSFKHGKTKQNPTQAEFWALKDLSFEIEQGDRVGIIGRNGAGKSTLLKVLSRITEPTTGSIRIKGRIASLLEVGTGFHPELTGRENIFLNGAILGMDKAEIHRKFDEIVDFAEVEKFLDTPVKRYSSGMYVRLAFSVAAHLEPEILIVDEVLAVGDAAFQNKCLGKMEDVGKEGRTVLFVSHNMATVEKLCHKGLFLRQGKVVFSGSQSEAIANYSTSLTNETFSLEDRLDRRGNGDLKIVKICIKDLEGNVLELATSGQTVDFYFYFEAYRSNISRAIVGLQISTQLDIPVFLQHNRLTQDDFGCLPSQGIFICRVERLPLPPANYLLNYSVYQDNTCLDILSNAMKLSVVDGDFYGSGEVPPISHGVCLVDGKWRIESL